MRIAIGSDEATAATTALIYHLNNAGHQLELYGPVAEQVAGHKTVEVAEQVAGRVATGACDQGILFCWTGTGVCMAANKFPGVRAALCNDAQTARGARLWNDANVLCMSLRLASEALVREIADAWFDAPFDESERSNLDRLTRLDVTTRTPLP